MSSDLSLQDICKDIQLSLVSLCVSRAALKSIRADDTAGEG
jgi:hypothetical protein